HFVRWVAPHRDQLQKRLAADTARLRSEAFESGQHRRTPGIVANLAAGLRYFLEFAGDAGALTAEEKSSLEQTAWTALGDVADAQRQYQQAGDPARRYLECLRAAIASGRAHAADKEGGAPSNPGAWGWRAE